MLRSFRRLNTNDALIALIIGIGAILRFYRLPDIPFTHDEFSAILRTQYSSFHDLIEHGVKIDGHPAGVQVFLYYLIKAFGVSEPVLKTPFIIFGLLAVWLVYLVGKEWFNPTAGLVAASFVSFLQFPVMYSQVARPYSSGLFFSLMMVWFWTRVVFRPERKFYLNLAGYIISGALCAYDHHFSMLFSIIVGLTGLFFCPRERRAGYVAAGIMIMVLYIPHIPILLHQLSIGGIEGWLNKPRYDFIFDYLQYVFQFSVYIYLLIMVLVSLSLYWYKEKPPVDGRFILISLIWFLLPCLVGFLYSKFRSSVLQYSVMIFTFPFLLFVLFGFFKTTSSRHKMILVSLIGIIVIPSLLFERKHYKLFYKGVYGEIVAESKKAVDSLGPGRCTVILDTQKEINHYYLEKLHCPALPFTYIGDLPGRGALVSWLDSCRSSSLAFGALSSTRWENYAVIREKFPYLVRHIPYCGGDFYIFSKIRPAVPSGEYYRTDSLALDPGIKEYSGEFSPAFSTSLRGLMHSENDVIDVSADIRTKPDFAGAWLVISVTSDGRDIRWNSVAISDYVKPGQQARVFQSLRLSDIEFRHHRIMFSAYIWNPKHSTYMMKNFILRARSGNPVIYGLYRKVGN